MKVPKPIKQATIKIKKEHIEKGKYKELLWLLLN